MANETNVVVRMEQARDQVTPAEYAGMLKEALGVSAETFDPSWAAHVERQRQRMDTYGWAQVSTNGVWYSPRVTQYAADVADVPVTAIHMTFTEAAELLWEEGHA